MKKSSAEQIEETQKYGGTSFLFSKSFHIFLII